MYTLIPQRFEAGVAVPAGAGTITLAAAQGVGTAWRVVWWKISIDRTVPAANAVQVSIANVDPAATALTQGGTTFIEGNIPEPGMQIPDNTAIVVNVNGSGAGGNAFATVYAFLDQDI